MKRRALLLPLPSVLLLVLLLAFTSCAPRYYPYQRPPLEHQPKFQ